MMSAREPPCWQCKPPSIDMTLRVDQTDTSVCLAPFHPSVDRDAVVDLRRAPSELLRLSDKPHQCAVLRYTGSMFLDKRNEHRCLTWLDFGAFWGFVDCHDESSAVSRHRPVAFRELVRQTSIELDAFERIGSDDNSEEQRGGYNAGGSGAALPTRAYCIGEHCLEAGELLCTSDPGRCTEDSCRCEDPSWQRQETLTVERRVCFTCAPPIIECTSDVKSCTAGPCSCPNAINEKVLVATPAVVPFARSNLLLTNVSASHQCFRCRPRTAGKSVGDILLGCVCILCGLIVGYSMPRLFGRFIGVADGRANASGSAFRNLKDVLVETFEDLFYGCQDFLVASWLTCRSTVLGNRSVALTAMHNVEQRQGCDGSVAQQDVVGGASANVLAAKRKESPQGKQPPLKGRTDLQHSGEIKTDAQRRALRQLKLRQNKAAIAATADLQQPTLRQNIAASATNLDSAVTDSNNSATGATEDHQPVDESWIDDVERQEKCQKQRVEAAKSGKKSARKRKTASASAESSTSAPVAKPASRPELTERPIYDFFFAARRSGFKCANEEEAASTVGSDKGILSTQASIKDASETTEMVRGTSPCSEDSVEALASLADPDCHYSAPQVDAANIEHVDKSRWEAMVDSDSSDPERVDTIPDITEHFAQAEVADRLAMAQASAGTMMDDTECATETAQDPIVNSSATPDEEHAHEYPPVFDVNAPEFMPFHVAQQVEEQLNLEWPPEARTFDDNLGLALADLTTVVIIGIPGSHGPESFRAQLDEWGLAGTYDLFFMHSGVMSRGSCAERRAVVNFVESRFVPVCVWIFQDKPHEGIVIVSQVQGFEMNRMNCSQLDAVDAKDTRGVSALIVVSDPEPLMWATLMSDSLVMGSQMVVYYTIPTQADAPARGQYSKTKMCGYYKKKQCRYGGECPFAHSKQELQPAPDLAKTRLCNNFLKGFCKDETCSFAHGYRELRGTENFFKTEMCRWYVAGTCRAGRQCRFAHNVEEVRNPGTQPAALVPPDPVEGVLAILPHEYVWGCVPSDESNTASAFADVPQQLDSSADEGLVVLESTSTVESDKMKTSLPNIDIGDSILVQHKTFIEVLNLTTTEDLLPPRMRRSFSEGDMDALAEALEMDAMDLDALDMEY